MTDFSFHAEVAAEAIAKVGRLFNATIDDILGELLQNARRAGATKVVIDQIDDPRFGKAVRIADNGAGLEDPRSLFSLGHSGWSEALSSSEDPAGMGFFALANRGTTIIAQRKGASESWFIQAGADAFHGKQPVNVRPGPHDHKGVTVIVPETASENIAGAVQHAARFYPVAVEFNGEIMPSSDFLAEAEHIEEWRGIRIGVFSRNPGRYNFDNANFHGVTLGMPLPELRQSWHRSFFAQVDVVDCAHLKLVLPARKEVVRNEMFDALLEEIDRIYFRLIAASGPHSLSFKDYQRGRTLGIALDEAAPALRPFSPVFAESDRNELLPAKSVGSNALIYEGGGALEEQNVARAFAAWGDAPPIFEPNHAFVGYLWYDRLSRIVLKSYKMFIGDVGEEIDPVGSVETEGRPDRLEIVIEIGDAKAVDIRHLETDLIVVGEEYGSPQGEDILVTRQSTITPVALRMFLIDALFCPSNDADAASYDQQLEWFSDEAEDLSVNLLQSAAEADINAIIRAVEREVAWRVPKKGSIVIRIDDRKVSVEGMPCAEDTAAESHPHLAG
ncbi:MULTISPECIES: hypothetical protein [Rhizobium/Agrobacterium group]|uniref:hypothetical protein n=1 Tax=Rhizobium/Agrobacterium group TaxID=227290 RepID=UPI00107F61F9|nr:MULTISPECIES: hypothetical protein [Rhizobium/Agrobacterium group]MBB4402992.1 hypothetical protein [Agrobacterium radiobacter]MBB5589097.1 hypothetical protein [Agrobacterium radiobacter]TGE86061.1 hypothetical protein C9418_24475 [Rhizobium sp. SEMIA 4032]